MHRTAIRKTVECKGAAKKRRQRGFFRLHRDKNANSSFSHPVWRARTQPVLWHHNRTSRYYRH